MRSRRDAINPRASKPNPIKIAGFRLCSSPLDELPETGSRTADVGVGVSSGGPDGGRDVGVTSAGTGVGVERKPGGNVRGGGGTCVGVPPPWPTTGDGELNANPKTAAIKRLLVSNQLNRL